VDGWQWGAMQWGAMSVIVMAAYTLMLTTILLVHALADDNTQGGYGGADGGQGGYGGADGTQGGYGENFQDQILGQLGGQLDKPQCPPHELPVTKKGFQIYANSTNVDTFSKNKPEFAAALEDCMNYAYTACSMICGMTSIKCEKHSAECFAKACKAHSDPGGCKAAGDAHVKNGKLLYRLGFVSKQATACECVPKGEVSERRKKELTDFYEKYAPDQSGKAKVLLKKYSDNWPVLMLSLHQKYTNSVLLVKVENDDENDKGGEDEKESQGGLDSPPPKEEVEKEPDGDNIEL